MRDTVAIIGVGLIGGSIGLALRKRGLARNVVGVGRRASSLRKAKECGAVTSTTTSLARGVAGAELVVVCTPVADIVSHVMEAAEHCPHGAIITDVGSTKGEIVAALNGKLPAEASFVGSHPLAGSEKNGPQHARDDLLVGRVVVVTPARHSAKQSVDEVCKFWKSLGARVVQKTPQEHDAALAATSHMPHVVAAALAAATDENDLPFAATGWLDTTRISAGDAELWRQILTANRTHVLKALGKFEKVLASFHAALEKNDQAQLLGLLNAGKKTRDSVGN